MNGPAAPGRAGLGRLAVRDVGRVFPPTVAVACRPVDDACSGAFPEERAVIAHAAPGRRREFLAGRACAHGALRELGVRARPLDRGPAGQPLWPPGVVGSITHAGGIAVAVAARTGQVLGLGVDLEPLHPRLDAAVDRLVRSDRERAGPAAAHPLAAHLPKIAFCAKECVYKAVFPQAGRELRFGDVTVEVDLAQGGFRAVTDAGLSPPGRVPTELCGRFVVVSGWLLAGVVVPGPGRDRAGHGVSRSGPRNT